MEYAAPRDDCGRSADFSSEQTFQNVFRRCVFSPHLLDLDETGGSRSPFYSAPVRSREGGGGRDVDAHMCPCGTTIESRAQCEIYKEERDELEAEMKKLDK